MARSCWTSRRSNTSSSSSSIDSIQEDSSCSADATESQTMGSTEADSREREVHPFKVAPGARSNEIHTSKYRWYTFLPYNLYDQFHNLANIYFLIIAMLQTIPSVSITSGRPLLLAPLGFVLSIAAVRDLVEDQKRKSADRAENERPACRLDALQRQVSSRWCDVRPGHVLRLRRGDPVPADALLLSSSEPSGSCAVETSNLDGETSHKQKVPVRPEGFDPQEAERAWAIRFEAPSADLYQFRGQLHVAGAHRPVGLSAGNLLLRGSSMQDAEWADCLVCYAGHDARIMKNSQSARFKTSQLDKAMNRVIRITFLIQMVLCLIGGFSAATWEARDSAEAQYLMLGNAVGIRMQSLGIFGFLGSLLTKGATWLLQLNNMVPISLVVMMTTVKYLQGKLVEMDEVLVDSRLKRHAEVHTSQVLESLGMVTHIFSDKTGTLTCNEMVYKACSVAGRIFGLDAPEGRAAAEAPRGAHADFAAGGQELLSAMGSQDPQQMAAIASFVLCHALCHTVSVHGAEYVGPSPDELALVWAASEVGLHFRGRSRQLAELEAENDERLLGALAVALGGPLPPPEKPDAPRSLRLEVLDICEFDSDRKRMSVIVRYPDGRAVLLLKGADSAVLPSVSAASGSREVHQHLHQFASRGLRTLCVASRDLPEEEYRAWALRYRAALASLGEDRAAQAQELAEELETAAGLGLLGITAIEDRLQDGVPETLEKLQRAGIVVWVLTGDKMETAISIGRSCRLLHRGIENVELAGGGPQRGALEGVRARPPPAQGRAVTIDGECLARVLADGDLRRLFHEVASGCKTVICCRVSPKQKADVVQMVQSLDTFSPVTLAIGDGANDVSMITAASVGVGLSGKEGAQAARSADFAIGQFRFLQRLLLVHGCESYRRNSVVVLYNFYKNFVLVMPSFLFGFAMAFSGQPFYEQIMYQLYNVFFTFWPVVLYAILDRPALDLASLEEDPTTYAPGRRQLYFNPKVFSFWMAAALLQGFLLTVGAFFGYADGDKPTSEVPTLDDMWLTGTVVFYWVVLGVNLTLIRRLRAVIPLVVFVTVVCVLSFPASVMMLDLSGSVFLHGMFNIMFGPMCIRFVLASALIMVTFMLVGEPLILISESRAYSAALAEPDQEPLLPDGE
ncbi:unnamed protein product [Prorocentrum cordatum]|uniref:Phospholipid-transporting ATPase n=1 Tax=Prorocentrum cordatum TaxID=2364126 RepID=A0ABN9QK97_9DINO|nr:unnamed protein product [Polarella glacialis]